MVERWNAKCFFAGFYDVDPLRDQAGDTVKTVVRQLCTGRDMLHGAQFLTLWTSNTLRKRGDRMAILGGLSAVYTGII